MKAKRFLIPLLLALCATWGCLHPAELPAANEAAEEKPQGEVPQAPAPHVKKTTAELLVGDWHIVSVNGKAVPKDWIYALEFTADGKLHAFLNDLKNPPRAKIGTYKLNEMSIKLDIPADAVDSARIVDVTIHSITDDELSITTWWEGSATKDILRRLKSQ